MLACLSTNMELNEKDQEVISYSGNADDAFLDLLDELFCTANEEYAAMVLDWFANDPTTPLEMFNGGFIFETWHWSAD